MIGIIAKPGSSIKKLPRKEFAFCYLDIRDFVKVFGGDLVERQDDFEIGYMSQFEVDGSEFLIIASKIFVKEGFGCWAVAGECDSIFLKLQSTLTQHFGPQLKLDRIHY
jgi:hypothetical protein